METVLIFIVLAIIFIMDIKTKEIPNTLSILLIVLGIVSRGIDFETGIIGMSLYPLPLIFIYGYVSDIYNKEVLGFGDIKIMLGIGYILGYTNFYNIYIFYMIAFCLASIVGIYYIIKKEKDNELPFAPFLIIAFAVIRGMI